MAEGKQHLHPIYSSPCVCILSYVACEPQAAHSKCGAGIRSRIPLMGFTETKPS